MRHSDQDDRWMRRALSLAEKARGEVYPNPRVGAVIVHKGQCVAEGYHERPGTKHAEAKAVELAEKKGFRKFHEATLYVNLEPCSHLKKRTPPCAPLIAEKKFRRIVIAHRDPYPLVSGRGIQLLRKSKIQVVTGVLHDEAAFLNQPFLKHQFFKTPYVTMKVALTFDGKMADDFGNSKWISNDEARGFVHELRSRVDTICVGKNTVNCDQPRLNTRWGRKAKSADKILIFGRPQQAHLEKIRKANRGAKIIVVTKRPQPRTSWLEVAPQKSLKKTLMVLRQEYDVSHILLEGGPHLIRQFLREGLVDEVILFYGRGFLGGRGRYNVFSEPQLKRLANSIRFQPRQARLIGGNVVVQGFLNVYRPDSKLRKSRRSQPSG